VRCDWARRDRSTLFYTGHSGGLSLSCSLASGGHSEGELRAGWLPSRAANLIVCRRKKEREKKREEEMRGGHSMGVLEPREQIEPDCSQVAALKGTTAQRDRKNSYRQCCTPLKSRKKNPMTFRVSTTIKSSGTKTSKISLVIFPRDALSLEL